MAGTPREELSELVSLLTAHLDWQRELGASGFASSGVAARGASGGGNSSGGGAREVAPRAAVPVREPAREPVAQDEPAAARAEQPSVKFERPDFLRKRPGSNGAPPRTPDERAVVTPTPAAIAAPRPPSAPPPSAPVVASAAPPTRAAEPPQAAPPPPVAKNLFGEVEPAPNGAPAPASNGTNGAPFTTPPLEGEARVRALDVLRDEVAGCTKCRLHAGRTKSVFARGNPFAPLVFVGEGPGRDEDLQGYPFVGAAGQLLDKIIGAMGLADDEFYVVNVAKCRPPNNRVPAPDEMAACGPYLVTQLDLVRPQYIVALGKTSASYLLGSTESMTRLRGKWHQWHGIPLLATWHPAYLLRTPEAKKDTWEDMKLVLQRMGRTPPKR